MAEALVNHFLKDSWQAFSAGVNPSIINPKAVTVLNELGINTDNYYSKSVKEFLNRDDLDLVITVCDHAKETCPVFLKPVKSIHIGFEDPADYNHLSDDIALPEFRRIRDEIREKIISLLNEISM
jgi:arsenate reductase